MRARFNRQTRDSRTLRQSTAASVRYACEPLEKRVLLSTINWSNMGSAGNDSDHFNLVFGSRAATARADVLAAFATWSRVITDFHNGSNTVNISVQMGTTPDTSYGAQARLTGFTNDGIPTNGTFTISSGADDNSDGIPDGAKWFTDPTPYDNSEFEGNIVNAFSGDAQSGSPAADKNDLFTVVLLETSHIMGFSNSPGLKIWTGGQLTQTGVTIPSGQMDSGGGNTYWRFHGSDVDALLDGNSQAAIDANAANYAQTGQGASPYGAVHVSGLIAGSQIVVNGVTTANVDSDNALYSAGRRYTVSRLDALILKDAYGYAITEPQTFGTFYDTLGSNGQVLIRGSSVASSDTITVSVSGSNLNVSVAIGNEIQGTAALSPWVTPFPLSSISSIVVHGNDGTDFIRLEGNGGIATFLYGDEGDDFFDFAFGSKNLSNITGLTNVFGGAGTDNIFVYDNNNSSPTTYNVDSAAVSRTGFGGMDYGIDLEGLTVTTSANADLVNVPSSFAGEPIYLNSAGGTDEVRVGSDSNGLQNIAADVQIQNTPSRTNLVINDGLDPFARNATIGTTNNGYGALSGMTPAASIYWKLSDAAGVNLYYNGNLDNTINVASTSIPVSVSADVRTSGGHETIKLGNSTNGMQGISATIAIPARVGVNTVILDDTHDSSARTITQSTIAGNFGEIAGLAASGALIDYANLNTSVTVNTSVAGNNTVNIHSNSVRINVVGAAPFGGPHDAINIGNAGSLAAILAPINVTNPTGFDDISINDSANGSPQTFTLSTFTQAGDPWGKVAFANSGVPEIDYKCADTSSIALTTGLGATVNIFDTGATPITSVNQSAQGHFVVNVYGNTGILNINHTGSGNAGLTANFGNAGNAQAVKGFISVISTDHCAVTVDDSTDTSPRSANLTSTSESSLTPGSITFPTNNTLIVYLGSGGDTVSVSSTPSYLEVDGGSGNDNLTVAGTTGATATSIYGFGGNDTINVGSTGLGLIAGPVIADGGIGIDTITVNDPSTSLGIGYTIAPTTVTTSLFFAGLTYSTAESLILNTGSGANVINVKGTAGTPVTINGNVGNDTVTVGDTVAKNVAGIVAVVTVNGGGGTNTLSLDDSSSSIAAVKVHLSPTQIGAATHDAFFVAGGGLTYSGIATLTLSTPNATTGDRIIAAPSTTTAFNVNAGNPAPPTSSGDSLTIAPAGVSGATNNPAGTGAGTYTFSNRQAITYTGVESIVFDNVPPTVINATFQYDTLPLTLSLTFSEDVSDSLMSSPITIVNQTVSGSVGYSLLAYDTINNIQTFSIAGPIADSNYRATLPAGAISDAVGNALVLDYTYDFFVLAGDANHDRHVDAADQAILNAHLGTSGPKTFSDGNFNYDNAIDSADTAILNSQLNDWLPPQGDLTLPTVGGNGAYTLRGETGLQALIDLYLAAPTTGTPAYRIFSGAATSFTLNAGSGNDSLTMDFNSNGVGPLPTGGMLCDGGGGTNAVNVLGKAVGFHSISLASTGGVNPMLTLEVDTIIAHLVNTQSVTIDPSTATDTLALSGTIASLVAPIIGAGIQSRSFSSISIDTSGTLLVPTNHNALGATDHADRFVLLTGALNLVQGTSNVTGTLDLGGNDMIISNPLNNSNFLLMQLTAAARAGLSGGAASPATGITSSDAAADPFHVKTIGLRFNMNGGGGGKLYGIGSPRGLFDGQDSISNDILIKSTYFGDTDLSGSINAADYSAIDTGFAFHQSGWANGDFNYDGTVNAADYSLIDTAFVMQAPAGGPLTVVAESSTSVSSHVQPKAVAVPVAASPATAAFHSVFADHLPAGDDNDLLVSARTGVVEWGCANADA